MKILQGTPESWADFSERLRGRFSKITEDDVAYTEGKEDKTLKKIGARLGRTTQEVMVLFESMKLAE
jgi:hypothetical protein